MATLHVGKRPEVRIVFSAVLVNAHFLVPQRPLLQNLGASPLFS